MCMYVNMYEDHLHSMYYKWALPVDSCWNRQVPGLPEKTSTCQSLSPSHSETKDSCKRGIVSLVNRGLSFSGVRIHSLWLCNKTLHYHVNTVAVTVALKVTLNFQTKSKTAVELWNQNGKLWNTWKKGRITQIIWNKTTRPKEIK